MKISKHYSRHEFACACGCGFDPVDIELIDILELIREHYNQPVFINSAARCQEYNRSIGSKDSSQHTKGKAADIYLDKVNLNSVRNFIDRLNPERFGLGIYNDFLHIDVRNSKARWDKRS